MRRLSIFPVFALFFFLSCQNKEVSEEIPKGFAFQFNPLEVTQILIKKNDPKSQDRWFAELHQQSRSWTLKGGKQGEDLVDSLADSRFIHHLLSTLQTLKITQRLDQKKISRTGLSQPRFELKWITPNGVHGISVGDEIPNSKETFSQLKGITPKGKVDAVRGAFLQMLHHLNSFEVLRHRRLATWDIHDVVQISIQENGKKTFEATKLGGSWANSKNQILKKNVQEWLERILHLRVASFIDQKQKSQEIQNWIQSSAQVIVSFRDRLGNIRKISARKKEGQLFALASTRPHSAFRLYPKSLRTLTPPK